MKLRGLFACAIVLALVSSPSLAQETGGTSPQTIQKGGTGASTASGARTNLGLGSMATQNSNGVAITGGTITGMPSPSAASDVAPKSYVDATATGLNILAQSGLATAAVLPNTPTYANGASGVGATLTAGSNTTLTVDGTAAPLATVVLVKNQASAFQNGVYTVTTAGSGAAAWVLTRATYFDQAAEMKAGSYTFITGGSTNALSSWTLQTAITTVGTDAVNFVQFAAGTAVTSVTITPGVGLGSSGSCSGSTINCQLNPAHLPVLGRLTLAQSTPVMTNASCGFAPCAAIQNLWFAPDGGYTVPVYNGTGQQLYPFNCAGANGCTSPTIGDTIGLLLPLAGSANWAANSCFDVFYAYVAGTMYFGTGPAWTTCAGSTITGTASSWSISGTTLTINTVASGMFSAGGLISNLNGTGGVVAQTYILQQLSGSAGAAGTYQLSQSSTTAGNGTLSQMGPSARGYSLAKLNGVPVNAGTMTLRYGAASTISVPANQATLLGTVATDAASAGKISYQFGTAASAGGAAIHNVWNYWNRKPVGTNVQDNGAQWTSNINPFNKNCHDSSSYRITLLSGLAEDAIGVTLQLQGAFTANTNPSGVNLVIGPIMDIDVFNTQVNYDFYGAGVTWSTNASWAPYTISARGSYAPVMGQHFFQCASAGDAGQFKMSTVGGGGQITNNFTAEFRN